MKQYPDYDKEHMAKVVGRSLPISTKFSVEVCRFIKGKKVSVAKQHLAEVIKLIRAVPIKISKREIPHQIGVGPAKFPKKIAAEVLSLVEGAEANAQFKGLNTSNLIIKKAAACKAATQWHYGRQKRRRMKRTNIEIIVEESKTVKEDKK